MTEQEYEKPVERVLYSCYTALYIGRCEGRKTKCHDIPMIIRRRMVLILLLNEDEFTPLWFPVEVVAQGLRFVFVDVVGEGFEEFFGLR